MTTHQKRRLAGAFLCMLLPTPDHPFHLQPRLRMVSVITSALADGVFSAARNSMQSMACAIRASLPPKDRSSTRTVSNGLCSNDSGDGRCQGSRCVVEAGASKESGRRRSSPLAEAVGEAVGEAVTDDSADTGGSGGAERADGRSLRRSRLTSRERARCCRVGSRDRAGAMAFSSPVGRLIRSIQTTCNPSSLPTDESGIGTRINMDSPVRVALIDTANAIGRCNLMRYPSSEARVRVLGTHRVPSASPSKELGWSVARFQGSQRSCRSFGTVPRQTTF
jgi:hypothetical protein